jgi:uncharacterized protein (TIGR03083 family)
MTLNSQRYLTSLERDAQAFRKVLVKGDLGAPVRHCPGWDLRELTVHLGGIHRWARTAVLERRPGDENADAPADRESLLAWFDEGAGALIETLRSTDPAAECWSFDPNLGTAAFWFRRQAHETMIHRWDAESSQGSAEPIDDELAIDGVDEVVTMFFPRQVRLGRVAAPERSLELAVTGGPRWVVAGSAAEPGAPAATIHGSAEALLLLVWGRTGLGDARLAVTGDPSAAHAVLSAGLTP